MTTRGRRRGDTDMARTLALFDTLGIRKRRHQFRVRLSQDATMAIFREAAERRVPVGAVAAFYVEKAIRERTA